MQVGTSDTDLRLVAIRELLVNAGCYVVVVNLFDCCHCKRGEWECTNAQHHGLVIALNMSMEHILRVHIFHFHVPMRVHDAMSLLSGYGPMTNLHSYI